MRAWFTGDRGVFTGLLVYLLLVGVADELISDVVLRLAILAVLAPFVAGALLSMRQATVVSAVYFVMTLLLYGPWTSDVSVPNRATILCGAGAVCAVSLAVCRVRLRREERIVRLRLTAGAAQRLLLRSLPLPAGDLLVDGFYAAADEESLVGGDIYEALPTPHGTRLVIGDVRGKGLAAIGASAAVLTAFREAAYQEPALESVVDRMEQGLLRYAETSGDRSGELFVTALVLETEGAGALRLIDCGHLRPFVVAGDEVVEVRINEPGLPLGLAELSSAPRRRQHVEVPPGGRVLMCTDGVVEARDPRGEFYPLADRLNEWVPLPTGELLERLRADLLRHAGGFLRDDAAFLVVQR